MSNEAPLADPQPDPQVTILVRHNGPYVVEGPLRLTDADGNEYTLEPGRKYSL